MSDLDKEIGELKQFIVDLKADRAAVKEKEKREAWIKYVSVTVVVIAVMSSIGSQWAGKYSTRAQTNQSHAFDTYNFYQAKSIKEHVDKLGRPILQSINGLDADGVKVLQTEQQNIPRYEADKEKLKADAEAYEAASKLAGAKGSKMGLAVSFLSVSIAMASMCLVTKKKPLWLLAILLAAIGVGEMVTAWTM